MRIVQVISGTPGDTTRVVSSDTAASLATAITQSNSKKAKFAMISIEIASVRFTFNGVTPVQGASAIGHKVAVGSVLHLESQKAIEEMKYISGDAGGAGVFQITVEF